MKTVRCHYLGIIDLHSSGYNMDSVTVTITVCYDIYQINTTGIGHHITK